MKTRIISGIIIGVVVAAVLACGILISPIFISAFLALLAALGIYELLHNAADIKSKPALIGACIYAALSAFTISVTVTYFIILSIFFFMYAAAITLKEHKSFSLSHIAFFCVMPIAVSFAFYCLGNIIDGKQGLYYLLLLLNFSSVCDMGAYFTGVTIGKHKLCPEISPKKTIEGAVGGIISSIIFTLVIVLSFGQTKMLLSTILLTIPLCIVGMIGDLFASTIKRAVGIKDYGTLIPGHGGILDRVDSILFIAPVIVALKALSVL